MIRVKIYFRKRMLMNNKTKLISKSSVEAVLSRADVVELVEDAFRKYALGDVILPEKISQIFDEKIQNRINCMPATLNYERVCGMKWVSVFPNNPKEGIRNVSGLMILSEIDHGLPIAVMDGTAITNIRTAAVAGTAVKYLSKTNSQVIGFIGAGREARSHLDVILKVRQQITTCYVSSRSDSTVVSFIDEEMKKHPYIEFVNCENNYEKAVRQADIIVTATSTQSDLLKAEWIKKGATYVHVGGWEDEFAVPKLADKIICDDWECVKHRGQTICRMYKKGLLHDSDIYADLKDIILRVKSGRESESEFIYFNSVGLAFLDVHFAKYVYDQLKESCEIDEFEF